MNLPTSNQQPTLLQVHGESGYSTDKPDSTYKDLTGNSEAVDWSLGLGPVVYTQTTVCWKH